MSCMKCFVVEDSTPMRREIASRLSRLPGTTVVGYATTCEQAISGIAETTPDLVTLDIHLERGSGITVLGAIRDAYPQLVIIVITNHADPFYRTRVLAEGADFFFDKSAEFDAAMSLCATLAAQSLPPVEVSS